jgi:putative ABC transport system permease protein
MKILNLIKIALKALSNNKFRAFLTMLGIIIGVASVIAMLAIGQGSRNSIQSQISSMGSNMLIVQPGAESYQGVRISNASSQTLTVDDYKAIAANADYIQAVSPGVNGSGQAIYGAQNWPTSIRGVNQDFLFIGKYEIASGTMFSERDIQTAAKVCVVGKTVVDNLFPDGENPIGKTIRFNKIPFKIIGELKEKGENTMGMDQDDLILAPYTTVQKRLLAITYLNSITASAVSEALAENAKESIETVMREQHKLKPGVEDDFHIRSQEELITMFSSISNILTVLLAVIAGISLLVGGIGIMNIMYVSVTERTREIGLRMAVGGRGIDILFQFLGESVMISFTGGLLGIILGIGSSFIVKNALHWPIFITTYSIVLSFAVCTFIGVFFGWYPARKASNLDPIDALRYE